MQIQLTATDLPVIENVLNKITENLIAKANKFLANERKVKQEYDKTVFLLRPFKEKPLKRNLPTQFESLDDVDAFFERLDTSVISGNWVRSDLYDDTYYCAMKRKKVSLVRDALKCATGIVTMNEAEFSNIGPLIEKSNN